MRAAGKPVSSTPGWISSFSTAPYGGTWLPFSNGPATAASPASMRARGQIILFIGVSTQLLILLTFFDNSPTSSLTSSTLLPSNPTADFTDFETLLKATDLPYEKRLQLLRTHRHAQLQHQTIVQLQHKLESILQNLQTSNSIIGTTSPDFNISHVNFPVRFERQLIPHTRTYRPSPFHSSAQAGKPDVGDPKSIVAPASRKVRGLKCVQIAGDRGLQSIEGIGAVYRLNQMAVFIASYFQVDLAFPSKTSEHGYDLSKFFSDCGHSQSYMDMPDECILNQEYMFIEECPAGDCHCLGNQIRPYLTQMLSEHGRKCSVIGVLSDRYKTQQFSGCVRPLLSRYFGTKPEGERPKWEFDAIHYRHGDLAEKPGGKSFAPYQLEHLMRTLCDMSERDIVILTEGSPPVPRCHGHRNRIVIANESIQHAFAIMQHAQHVAVGLGGFSIILAEMAKPTRMIMLDLHVRFFRWLSCDAWTVVTGSGARYHFGSRAHMLLYALSSANLHRERFLNPGDIKLKRLEWAVPSRAFESKLLGPVKLRAAVGPGGVGSGGVLRDGENEG